MAKKSKILLETEAKLAAESRAYKAMAEWFTCTQRNLSTYALDVAIPDRCDAVLKVTVHGITRASGGVVVVHVVGSDYSDFPRYLDDLCAEWSADCSPYIREAARKLNVIREEACAV